MRLTLSDSLPTFVTSVSLEGLTNPLPTTHQRVPVAQFFGFGAAHPHSLLASTTKLKMANTMMAVLLKGFGGVEQMCVCAYLSIGLLTHTTMVASHLAIG